MLSTSTSLRSLPTLKQVQIKNKSYPACSFIVIAAKCHGFHPFHRGRYLAHHLRSQSVKRPVTLQLTFVDFYL